MKAAEQGSGIIRPHCFCISNQQGYSTLAISGNPSSAGNQGSTIVPKLANAERLGDGFLRIMVETRTLDSICLSQETIPSVIKIDVEGAENLVVEGAQQTINDHLPVIIFECGWSRGDPVPQHFSFLTGLGYSMFCIDRMYVHSTWVEDRYPYLSPITENDFERAPTFLCNLLAIHPHQKEALTRIASHISSAGFLETI